MLQPCSNCGTLICITCGEQICPTSMKDLQDSSQDTKDSSSPGSLQEDLRFLIEDFLELDPDQYEYDDEGDPFGYPWEGPHLDGCACPTCRVKRVKRREILDIYLAQGGIL